MSTQIVQALHPLLYKELLLATRLYEVLAQELAALERLDINSIQSLAQEKNRLLIALDEQTCLRDKQFPYALDMNTLIQITQDVAKPLVNEFYRLVEDYRMLLRRCQTQNEINGRIIGLNRRSIDRQLSLLRGQPTNSILYNQRGTASRTDSKVQYAVA